MSLRERAQAYQGSQPGLPAIDVTPQILAALLGIAEDFDGYDGADLD
jgi:hypothetical protein